MGIDWLDPISVSTFGLTSTGEITGADEAAAAAGEAATKSAEATIAATEKNIDFQKWLWGEQKALTEPWRQAGGQALGQLQQYTSPGYDFASGQRPFGADPNIPYAPPSTDLNLDLFKDPSYQFRLSEGMKGIEASAAARGLGLSGRTLKELGRYSQGLASEEYGNMYSRAAQDYARQSGAAMDLYNVGVGQYGRQLGQYTLDYNQRYGRHQDKLNRLSALANVGQTTAQGQAGAGGVMGGNVSQSIMQGGQAQSQLYSNLGQIQSAQAMAPFQSLMQIGGLGALAFAASDRRIKENIKKVGKLDNGLPVYLFNYKGHPTPMIGLMAQDVEIDNPNAVLEINGIKHVNYVEATHGH